MLTNEVFDDSTLDSGSKTVDDISTICDSEGDLEYVYLVMSSVLTTGEETALDSIVAAHQGTPTTDAPQKDEVQGETSENTSTWSTKLDFTCDELREGLWQFFVFYELKCSGEGDEKANVRIRFDDTTYINNSNYEADDSYQALGRPFALNIKEGDTPNVKVQLNKTGTGSGIAYIRRIQVFGILVSPYQYALPGA
jgi:type 1 fimbria pilin